MRAYTAAFFGTTTGYLVLRFDNVPQPGIQGDQHIQAFRFTYLAHDEAIGAHTQRFLHEPPQRNLAVALEVRLPALEAHHIPEGKLEFENLLHCDDSFTGTDTGAQTIQHGGLACLRCTGNKDVETTCYRGTEESSCLWRQGAKLNQMF